MQNKYTKCEHVVGEDDEVTDTAAAAVAVDTVPVWQPAAFVLSDAVQAAAALVATWVSGMPCTGWLSRVLCKCAY